MMNSRRFTILLTACAIGILSPTVRADGDDGPHPRFDAPPLEVQANEVPTIQVMLHPSTSTAGAPGGGPRGVCPPEVQTYSDQPFMGSITATFPPGMVEQEIAASTYSVPSTDWPVVLRTAEIIWGQNHLNSTTTEYSLMVWQGNPESGTLIETYSSDGDIIPHVNLPVGVAQVANLQVTIDPGDPDQIIIANDGSNTFSIGFRIDRHNNPPVTACTEPCAGLGSLPAICCPPNEASNAWPGMDAAGPGEFASMQWLFARDCPGATGLCSLAVSPGWFQLSDSATLPPNFVNDWAMRVTYEPVNCVIPDGACCMEDGSCEESTLSECNGNSGTYQGDNTLCSGVTCTQPTGACCFMPSGCVDLTEANCMGANGTWNGFETDCGTIICFPTGVCCMPDGSCLDAVLDTDCDTMGGEFFGDGTMCSGVNCPLPLGACCLTTGFCIDLDEVLCGQIPDSQWMGMGTDCTDGNGNTVADDCESVDPCDGVLLGDYDSSGVVDGGDAQGFVAAMTSASPSQGDVCSGDFNANSGLDIGDVAGMVAAMLN